MTASSFMQSPLWQTAGWMMLHFVWVGGAIGLLAAAGRLLLRAANPEKRYAFALGCFAALALSPAFILGYLFLNPPHYSSQPKVSLTMPPPVLEPRHVSSVPFVDPALSETHELPTESVASHHSNTNPDGERRLAVLAPIARYLPWLWLIGAPLTLLLATSGLIGVERLRRQSSLLRHGELPDLCLRLAGTLGIVRQVAVGVCDRLAAPILVGVVRPLILLPPAALTGWSVEQLEMVLLHELAHVRRWDTLVNLLQRIVEPLLFFHPAVWWISSWLRLERELCCDQIVIAQTGRPQAYALVLATLAIPDPAIRNAAIAISENHLVTRIRRILNLEDRTMKVSPKALGFVAALMIASVIVIGLYAKPANNAGDREPPQKNEDERKNPAPPAPLVVPELPPGTQPPVLVPTNRQPPANAPSDKKPANGAQQFPAEIQASEQVDLHTRISGIVEKVQVDIGDRVKKGQVLAELAVPELEAEYKQKQAGVEQAKAEVEVARLSAQASRAGLEAVNIQIREVEAGIKVAQATLARWKSEAERMEKLSNNKAVDRATLDETRTKLDVAKAALDAAEARGQVAKATVEEGKAKYAKTEAERKVAEAKLVVAKADLYRIAVVLQFARVQAPFDGIVTRRTVDAGSFAQSADRGKSEPLFVVARTDILRVVVHVPETIATRVDKGTRAVIRIEALKGKEFEGKVARIAGVIDPKTRTLRAEIDLPNPDGKIMPGMFAQASITLEK